MAKTLTLNKTEVDATGAVFAEFSKLSSDGDFLGIHRVSIPKNTDVDAAITGVSTALATENFSAITTGDHTKIKGIATAAWA